MYVCMYVKLYSSIQQIIYFVCIYVYVCTHEQTSLHFMSHISLSTLFDIIVEGVPHVYIYIYMWDIYIYIYMYIYVHIYIYMHMDKSI